MIYLFILFYFFAIYAEAFSPKRKEQFFLITCVVLAIGAGFRDQMIWPDTDGYSLQFREYTPSMGEYKTGDRPFGYGEMGFYFIGVIVKSFTTNSSIYLTIVSVITFIFLYYDFKKYALYPFLGISAYLARFFIGRNLIQIRSALAYAIILLGIQYLTKHDWKRYFGLVFIAYFFHHSAIIAIPLYFISLIDFRKWHVVMVLLLAFIVGGFFTETLQYYIIDTSQDLDIATTYTQGAYVEEAKGLANPLIYLQSFLLLAYTFNEEKLRLVVPHYYTIRTSYLYSTFILTAFSMFTALSGRTSTMFATLEFVIIPSLVYMFDRRNRWVAYIGMGVALTVIMYMNINGRA